MTVRPRPLLRAASALVIVLLVPSCSRGGNDLAEPNPSSAVGAAPSSAADGASEAAGSGGDDADRDESGLDESTGLGTSSTDPGSSAPTSTGAAGVTTPPPSNIVVTLPEASVAELPEIGVPGLDSADAFCAAWSRFAGSFQVVAVTAAFGSGRPEQLAALEVAASPVVTEAYDSLLANWPAELSSEADIVAEQYLGPFARRLDVALTSLRDGDANAERIDEIANAWLAGLARRDPSTPEFSVDLDPAAWAVIDVAASDFAAQLVPFSQDPSLVTNANTPLTDEYLARSCPDQGTLSGQEVETP